MAKKNHDDNRAKRTIYVTGFNPKLINKHLLEELFAQGGPVREITLFETHAYILFEDEDSVPYCLALFKDIELHGRKLRLSPRFKTNDKLNYVRHLKSIRDKLMSKYNKLPPPDLPPKIMPKRTWGKQQAAKNKSENGESNKKSTNDKSIKRHSSKEDNFKFAGVARHQVDKQQANAKKRLAIKKSKSKNKNNNNKNNSNNSKNKPKRTTKHKPRAKKTRV